MSFGLRKHIINFIEKRLSRLLPLLVLAAFLYPLLLPIYFSRKNFFDENALLPHNSDTIVGPHAEAHEQIIAYSQMDISDVMSKLLRDCSLCTLEDAKGNSSTVSLLMLHAGRSSGAEVLVLQTFTDRMKSSLPILYRVFQSYSSKAHWLQHNLMLVVVDREGSEIVTEVVMQNILRKGMSVRAAIILDIPELTSSTVFVDTIGYYGKQPNMDFINVLLGAAHQGGLSFSLIDSTIQKSSSPIPDLITDMQWYEVRFYFQYIWESLLRRPQHAVHRVYREYDVLSVTIRPMKKVKKDVHVLSYGVHYAMAIDHTLRCMNNLNERLHHSFFVWFPISHVKFVDIEKAQIQQFILVGTLYVHAGAIPYTWSTLHVAVVGAVYVLSVGLYTLYTLFDHYGIITIFLGSIVVLSIRWKVKNFLWDSSAYRPTTPRSFVLLVTASALCGLGVVHPTLSLVCSVAVLSYATIMPWGTAPSADGQSSTLFHKVLYWSRVVLFVALCPLIVEGYFLQGRKGGGDYYWSPDVRESMRWCVVPAYVLLALG